MTTLKTYDYQAIIDQLVKARPNYPDYTEAIDDFIYYLENDYRMHWIDVALIEDHQECIETLAAKLNIELSYVD
jgi:hypothetical protein